MLEYSETVYVYPYIYRDFTDLDIGVGVDG